MPFIQSVRSIRAAAALSTLMTVAMWAADSQAQVLGPATVNDFVTLHDTPGGGWCEWTRKGPTGPDSAWPPPSTTALVLVAPRANSQFCALVNGPPTFSVRVTVQGYLVALVQRAN